MRARTMFGLWLPLAISFELMMLEGPAVQGAIGRLQDSALNLAAWGLTIGLSMLIESPVIMLLATSIALVKGASSYRALRRFMVFLSLVCTLLTALIVFTPVFDLIAGRLMGVPAPIVRAARPAMQILLLWTAAIAWRRFYQGVLVRYGQTRKLSWGTSLRLMTAVGTSIGLVWWGKIPGVQVAAWALIAAVLIEAAAVTLFAQSILHAKVLRPGLTEDPPLSQREIARFHTPLAATTILTLLAEPLTSAALARLAMPKATLAAWPIAFMLLLVIRGGGLALQEITVAHASIPSSRPALWKLTWLVGLGTTVITALIVSTPLLNLYLDHTLHLPPSLKGYVFQGVLAGLLTPLVTALGSWARGVLVAAGATQSVYRGMGFNLIVHSTLLLTGVLLRLPGMWAASGAFSLASFLEFAYLLQRMRACHALEAESAPSALQQPI